jgi:hypothetical protein
MKDGVSWHMNMKIKPVWRIHLELIAKVRYTLSWKSNEMHMDILCILYFTILALCVSGVICTHHQEHKLQSTAVGTRDGYGVLEVG